MSRQWRVEYEGAVYHVTACGNGRQAIYRANTDRRRFLDLLERKVDQQHWFFLAYPVDTPYHYP